jgi:hypothetical protein
MGRMYLLSTGYIPVQLEKWKKVVVVQRIVSVQEAKQLLSNGFVSAVGHQSTAEIMSQILGIPIQYSRQSVFLEPGDEAICFVLKQRPPEGRVLTAEELQQIGFYFVYAKVLSSELMNELVAQGIC